MQVAVDSTSCQQTRLFKGGDAFYTAVGGGTGDDTKLVTYWGENGDVTVEASSGAGGASKAARSCMTFNGLVSGLLSP